jgi:hypothetical protein
MFECNITRYDDAHVQRRRPQRVKCGCPFGLRSWVPEGGKPGEVRYRPARPPYIETREGMVVLGEDYMGIGWDGVAGRAL